MKRLINCFKLLFLCSEELEQLLLEKRYEKELKLREEQKHCLNLCFKHRQESNHSHYAEHNCDYCKLLKELENCSL